MKTKRWWVVALALLPMAVLAAEAVRIVVTLKHRDARSVLARVSQELGPKGRISVDGEKNRIVVEDDAAIVQKVTRLIGQLDQPARRFALGARLEVYPTPANDPLFSKDGTLVDMTHWFKGAKAEKSYDALLNLDEGGAATAVLGAEFGLSVTAGGYDPSQRRLSLRNLSLWRGAGPARQTLLSGGAALPEGQTTALVVGAEKTHPPLKLHLTPSLLPRVEGGGEVPR
jgi:hypothetical protein